LVSLFTDATKDTTTEMVRNIHVSIMISQRQ
jgi:hypothetical protein